MKKYTKNEIKKINHFYAGGAQKRISNLQAKTGITRQEDIRKRMSRIRADEPDFKLYGYITIYNVTKTRLEALEHEVKANLEDCHLQNTGNDHFTFKAVKGYNATFHYTLFSILALKFAIEYCDNYNLKYTLTWEA